MSWQKKSLFIFVIIIFFLFFIRILDALVGVFLPEEAIPRRQMPPNTTYYVNENSKHQYQVRVNSLGLRSPELPETKKNPRILFLGDSFLYGDNIAEEHTFARITESRLRAGNSGVNVINAGVVQTAPIHGLRNYKRIGKKVQPDLVLLCIYSNDIHESDPSPSLLYVALRNRFQKNIFIRGAFWLAPTVSNTIFRMWSRKHFSNISAQGVVAAPSASNVASQPSSPDTTSSPAPSNAPAELSNELKKKFYVQGIKTLVESLDISPDRFNLWLKNVDGPLLNDGTSGVISPLIITSGLLDPDQFVVSLDLEKGGLKKYEKMMESVEALRQELARDQIKFGIIYIPTEYQYDSDKFKLGRRLLSNMRAEWLTKKSNLEKQLESYVHKHEIAFLNLTGNFRKHAGEKLVYDVDIHFNKRGHEVAAQYITEFIVTHFPDTLKN